MRRRVKRSRPRPRSLPCLLQCLPLAVWCARTASKFIGADWLRIHQPLSLGILHLQPLHQLPQWLLREVAGRDNVFIHHKKSALGLPR